MFILSMLRQERAISSIQPTQSSLLSPAISTKGVAKDISPQIPTQMPEVSPLSLVQKQSQLIWQKAETITQPSPFSSTAHRAKKKLLIIRPATATRLTRQSALRMLMNLYLLVRKMQSSIMAISLTTDPTIIPLWSTSCPSNRSRSREGSSSSMYMQIKQNRTSWPNTLTLLPRSQVQNRCQTSPFCSYYQLSGCMTISMGSAALELRVWICCSQRTASRLKPITKRFSGDYTMCQRARQNMYRHSILRYIISTSKLLNPLYSRVGRISPRGYARLATAKF